MRTRLRAEETVPWMPDFRYGARLPPLSLNLIIRGTACTAAFCHETLEVEVHCQNIGSAAVLIDQAKRPLTLRLGP